jgi:hypothetical protein
MDSVLDNAKEQRLAKLVRTSVQSVHEEEDEEDADIATCGPLLRLACAMTLLLAALYPGVLGGNPCEWTAA